MTLWCHRYRFERSKLTTKTTKRTKEVTLDGTQFAQLLLLYRNALQTILPFSYPNQLSSYSVDKVKFAWGEDHRKVLST